MNKPINTGDYVKIKPELNYINTGINIDKLKELKQLIGIITELPMSYNGVYTVLFEEDKGYYFTEDQLIKAENPKQHIYKQIQHRAELRYLNKEMRDYIRTKHPEIKYNNMVEIIETRSFELQNTWEIEDNNDRNGVVVK